MTKEKYLEYRTLFESRYNPIDLGYSILDDMLKDIYNKKLFLNIYAFDKICYFNCLVSSIDKNTKYYICKNGSIGSRIKIQKENRSMIDKFDNFETLKSYIQYDMFKNPINFKRK